MSTRSNGLKLSIIIPVYNSEDWIIPTLKHIEHALDPTNIEAEVIIIDDGSTDATVNRVKGITVINQTPVKLVEQTNKGRYLARKAGVDAASYDTILFIDSRVFINESSLKFVESKIRKDNQQVWNGHVYVAKEGNLFARFWDAIVFIAWRKYFGNPRECSFGLKDFDYYPKGTGFFLVPKLLLEEAMSHFEGTTNDLKHSSDDTLLIRFIAAKLPIHLSPEFSCQYHGRNTLKKFLNHAYYRGQFFVDGFLRPGTRFFLPLLLFLVASVALPALLIIMPPAYILFALFAALLLWVTELIVALVLGVPFKDAFALFLLTPLFAIVYGAGIWRGVIRRVGK